MAGLEWDVTRIVAGLLMLTVAMWVVALEPRSRLMQLFAVFMVFRGLVNIMLPFADELTASADLNVLTTTVTYYQIAVPFAAMAFAMQLLLPPGKRARTVVALGVAGLFCEVAFFFDKSSFYGDGVRGWLHQILGLQSLAYVVVGHALLRGDDVPVSRFAAGVTYMLFPVYAASFGVAEFVEYGTRADIWSASASQWSDVMLRVATLGYAVVVTIQLVLGVGGRRRTWSLVGLISAVVTGVLPWFVAPILGVGVFVSSLPMNGIYTAAMPIAVTWALTHDAFYTKFRVIRMSVWVATILFGTIWVLIVGALYAAVEGATAAAAITGSLALAVLLFLLLQSSGIDEARRGRADNDEVR